MITVSPPETSVRNGPVPTTAGMPSASATIAVWLPGPPISVTKPRHELRIEIRRFAGRQIVRQHQHFGHDVRQLLAAPAEQMPQQPLLDVEDVVGPLGHVVAFERLKHLGVVPQHAAHRVLGRVVPLADHLLELRAQPAVVEHLDVGGEDRAVFLAELLGDAVAIALDLGGGGGDRLIEPLQLVFDGIARQEPTRDAKSLVVHDERFADRHAGRNGNSLKTFHVVSRCDRLLRAMRSERHGGGPSEWSFTEGVRPK